MPEQETNQEQLEQQANPEGEPIVNPQGSEEPTGQEPQPSAEESPEELSQERIQELVQLEQAVKEANITDFRGLMSDYTQKSQRLPVVEQEREHALHLARQAMGEKAAAQDPIEAKRQAWVEAQQSYEPERIAATFDEYQSATFARERQKTLQESNRVQEMRASFEQSKRWGDYSTEQLGETYQSITLDDLALVRRNRQGDLPDVMSANTEQRKVEASKKARMNQLFGQSSGGAVPGSFEESPKPSMDWIEWVQLNEETKKSLEDRGVQVVNAPGPPA